MKQRLEYMLKHNVVLLALYKNVMSAVMSFIGLFVRVDQNLVLLSSYSGKRFDDSPKVLFEEMKNRPECASFNYVWALNEPSKFAIEGATCVRMDSLKYFITALKAKYWITNVNIERGLRFKKKETIYVNTWHGTGPKKGGNGAPGRSDYDFSYVDILTSDGEYQTQEFVEDFNAKRDNIMLIGRPREDELYRMKEDDSREIVCHELGIDPSKKLLLYAPTWRDSNYGNSEKPPADLAKWARSLGEDWVVGFRAHSLMANGYKDVFCDSIVDFSQAKSVNKLMLVADVLISDYSSMFTDYSILGKPMLCFAYDYEEYVSNWGVYFDIRDYVTSFANEDDLLEYLLSMDCKAEAEKAARFYSRFAGYGGNASSQCIDRMLVLANRQNQAGR